MTLNEDEDDCMRWIARGDNNVHKLNRRILTRLYTAGMIEYAGDSTVVLTSEGLAALPLNADVLVNAVGVGVVTVRPRSTREGRGAPLTNAEKMKRHRSNVQAKQDELLFAASRVLSVYGIAHTVEVVASVVEGLRTLQRREEIDRARGEALYNGQD